MKKRKIKQLMALGIQRNDANAFLRVYDALSRARKTELLPAILHPVLIPRVQAEECRAVPIRAMLIIPHDQIALQRNFEVSVDVNLVESIKRRLENEIITAIKNNGVIKYEARSAGVFGTEYIATLRVLLPY